MWDNARFKTTANTVIFSVTSHSEVFYTPEKCDDTNECSVEKTAHVDVLPASNARGTDALNETIDEVAKIAVWL
jgi:hypothetical protein